MARIIEYNEGDYGESRGYGGGAALLVIVVLIVLYLSGSFPWFTSAAPAGQTGFLASPPAVITVPAGNIGYVTAERLNMREAAGGYAPVTYILPRGTKVTLLGNSYREPDGDFWVQVRIETYEGPQIGWVNRAYIS